MREIMFRGIVNSDPFLVGDTVSIRDWVYGNLIVADNGDHFITTWKRTEGVGYESKTYQVDAETVGQYTGIKDKNEKMIFEGDIVLGLKCLKAKIVYGSCGFEFEWIDGKSNKVRGRKSEEMFHNTSIIFEVIGTIHD